MLRTLALVALAVTCAAAPDRPAAQEPRLVRMGTASLAGAYFPVGVALCRLVNEDRRVHGIRCAAQPSAGSVANIQALRAGEIDLALVQSDVQDAALKGTGALAEDGPFPELRAVLSLYPEALTVVARREAGIAGLGDLPGTRISPGPPGSGQRELWEAVSAAMGWTAEDFAAVLDLAPTDQAAALCDGLIDAFVIVIGHPAPTVREATSGCDANLVPVTGPQIAALVEDHPYFAEAEIPGGLYRGNPAPVASFGVMATLVTRADVADPVIATLVGAAFGKLDSLLALDPVLAGLQAEAMANAGRTAPLHPAAESYFRAQGLAP
jgi:TRAP transporter TAXI family solute receptor